MKDFFEDLGKKLTETAETMGKITEEVVEIQKLKSQIRTMDRNNDRDIFDLGKMVFEKYKEGDVIDSEYQPLCEGITKRIEDITRYEEQVAMLKGVGLCPSCKEHIDRDMLFCPYCGCKVEKDTKNEEPTEDAFVPEDSFVSEEVESFSEKHAEEVAESIIEAVAKVKEEELIDVAKEIETAMCDTEDK